MLFALIAITWLALAGLSWTVCAMAARGNAKSAPPSAETSKPETIKAGEPREGFLIWESLPELAMRDARLTIHSVR